MRFCEVDELMGKATPDITEIIYMAGVLDGEGYVGISCAHGRTYHPQVQVPQTSRTWLERFQSVWGGRVLENFKEDKRRALIWQWVIRGKEMVTLLETAKPYLRIKGEQAELVLELQRRIDRSSGRGRHLLQEEREARHNLYQRCRLLNQTGPRNDQLLFEFKVTSQFPLL